MVAPPLSDAAASYQLAEFDRLTNPGNRYEDCFECGGVVQRSTKDYMLVCTECGVSQPGGALELTGDLEAEHAAHTSSS